MFGMECAGVFCKPRLWLKPLIVLATIPLSTHYWSKTFPNRTVHSLGPNMKQYGAFRGGKKREGNINVISLILFNVALESRMRKWKLKLHHHGMDVGAVERLTHIRCAGDLALYAFSCCGLVYLGEDFILELERAGLKLNAIIGPIAETIGAPHGWFKAFPLPVLIQLF